MVSYYFGIWWVLIVDKECCVFLPCVDLLLQSFLLWFSRSFLDHSCVFEIVHGNNLSHLLAVLISWRFCIFFNVSGVGDRFFSKYSSSRMFISFFFYSRVFLLAYRIFYFLMENLYENSIKLYSWIIVYNIQFQRSLW